MLLDLPDEVLDACLSNLLPPLSHGSFCIDALDNIPAPTDLCSLGLVCKTLYNLALPWMWRRAEILLGDVAPLHESHLVPGQWEYLCNHPEVATYIRVLKLTFTESQTLSLSLTAFRFVLGYIQNVQLLCLDFFHTHRVIDIIYAQLISQPNLRILLITHETSKSLHTVTTHSSLPYLTHLHISACPWELHLLESAINLKGLSIAFIEVSEFKFPWMTLPIPWETLCEIIILGVENWHDVFTNFALWKESFPTASSPLKEISIESERTFITTEQFQQIMVFGAQLEYLSLYGFKYIDESCLAWLVESFPQLQRLGLYINYHCWPWDAELPTIVNLLGKLKHLQQLEWNYIINPDANKACLPTIVQELARGCQVLECVVFFDYDGWNSFEIQRDTQGGYAGHVEHSGRSSGVASCSTPS